MTEGHKLYLTAHFAFNYDESQFNHLVQFDILTQFFEKRNNLQGFIDDEDGPRIEEYSDVAILMDALYEGFDNRDVPKVVEGYLLKFEMYTTLVEYHAPLDEEALKYKEELLTELI